jgi:hypothetical protein
MSIGAYVVMTIKCWECLSDSAKEEWEREKYKAVGCDVNNY